MIARKPKPDGYVLSGPDGMLYPRSFATTKHGRARRDLSGRETIVRNRMLEELGIGDVLRQAAHALERAGMPIAANDVLEALASPRWREYEVEKKATPAPALEADR